LSTAIVEQLKERIERWLEYVKSWRYTPEHPVPDTFANDPNLIEDLLSGYVSATQEERSLIRGIVADAHLGNSFLGDPIRDYTRNLKATKDPAWLWKALVAFSILEAEDDYIDLKPLFSDLYQTAIQGVIEPDPYFEQARQMSTFGRGSTGGFLSNFREHAYFKMEVQP
jgi:hypothetical protein